MKCSLTPAGTPYDIQNQAYQFILRNKRAYVMSDPGEGKTLISLMTMRKLDRPFFVFAPLRVIYDTWPKEIQKWYPGMTWTVLHDRKKDMKLFRKVDAYLINYDGVPWLHKQCCARKMILRKYPVVFDESTEVKEPSTKRFKLLQKLMPLFSQYRINLSGTPTPTGLHNLWSQYYLLDEGAHLGKFYTPFRDTYFHFSGPPYYKTDIKSPAHEQMIYEKVAPITCRLEAKNEIPVEHITYRIKMSPDVKAIYERMLQDAMLEFQGGLTINTFSDMMQRSKLRQIIQGGIYTNPEGDYRLIHDLKAQAVAEILSDENNMEAIVPINFKFELDILQNKLGKLPFITGATSAKESMKIIKAWNDGYIPVLLVHPKSIRYGLNMQEHGESIIWHALPSTVDTHLQVIRRIARQGRKDPTKPVKNFHIVMSNTLDTNILPVLRNRYATQRDLFEAVKRGLGV